MSDPNATPTRADVLREFREKKKPWCRECGDELGDYMADEVLRLRAHRDAMIRRVEALPPYRYENLVLGGGLSRDAVLAALREGGDA